MGLGERRARYEFETGTLPEVERRIAEVAGVTIPVEVKWDTIIVEGAADDFRDAWSKVYFDPLVAGVSSVGRDDMGKEALREGLRKIIVQNTRGCHYPNTWVEFSGGVLVLDHEPMTNISEGEERTAFLIKALEAGL